MCNIDKASILLSALRNKLIPARFVMSRISIDACVRSSSSSQVLSILRQTSCSVSDTPDTMQNIFTVPQA